MRKNFGAFFSNADGASAIEFALVVPIFLTLVFGIVVYGFYFATLNAVNHIAYEAARASVTGLTDAERTSLATARATALMGTYGALLDPAAMTIQAAPDGTGVFAVTVTNQFTALGLGTISAFLPMPPSTQTATVQMSRGGY
jgi:Flp pilus assembly protein TadG